MFEREMLRLTKVKVADLGAKIGMPYEGICKLAIDARLGLCPRGSHFSLPDSNLHLELTEGEILYYASEPYGGETNPKWIVRLTQHQSFIARGSAVCDEKHRFPPKNVFVFRVL